MKTIEGAKIVRRNKNAEGGIPLRQGFMLCYSDLFELCLAAVIVVAAAATAAAIGQVGTVVIAAAAEQQDENDDPPATTETIRITHNFEPPFLFEHSAHSIL